MFARLEHALDRQRVLIALELGHRSTHRPSACSRSQIRSSTDSVPTDNLTVPGPTPAASSSASLSWRCVVLAGWMIRLLRVADVGEVRPERHAADQVLPAASPTGAVEREYRPRAARQVFLDERPVAAARQARIGDVRGELVRLEKRRDRQRVLDVPLHPQRQRLESLQEQERVERRKRAPRSRKRLGPQLHQVAVGAEGLMELQAMIGGRRIRDHREASVRPVERAASTTTPPMLVPWPPMNLVAEWITMSAPHSIGRHRYGVANVLSTISGSSCS